MHHFIRFQHTAARRRLGAVTTHHARVLNVSTHSRPKAAGPYRLIRGWQIQFQHTAARRRLDVRKVNAVYYALFQHTAARRRLGIWTNGILYVLKFQHTAARRRLVLYYLLNYLFFLVSTHSRPKAAGGRLFGKRIAETVSTHSRPKAAGTGICLMHMQGLPVSTHSRPKAAGASLKSLAPSGFAALISLSSQEKRECEYNTAFSVTPAFSIS